MFLGIGNDLTQQIIIKNRSLQLFSHIHIFIHFLFAKKNTKLWNKDWDESILISLTKQVRNKIYWLSFDWNLDVLHLRSKRLLTNECEHPKDTRKLMTFNDGRLVWFGVCYLRWIWFSFRYCWAISKMALLENVLNNKKLQKHFFGIKFARWNSINISWKKHSENNFIKSTLKIQIPKIMFQKSMF